jgi:hypothetical protein
MTWGLTRAKSGRLRVKKRDKAGREYIGQNEVVVSAGMHSAREMERELQRAADESSEEVIGTEVDVYSPRETPAIETPTRLHGSQTQWGGFQAASWLPESPVLRQMSLRDGVQAISERASDATGASDASSA